MAFAIWLQVAALWRQAFAHAIIAASSFPRLSHNEAHRVQISEHTPQTLGDISEFLSMKSTDVWHICAQSIMVLIIPASQLPVSRHFV